MTIPKPSSLRAVGTFAGPVPFGATLRDDARDVLVSLPDVHSPKELIAALPTDLQPGSLIVLMPFAAKKKGFLAAFASRTELPRELRASALLAHGCIGIGAAEDPATKLDLVWAVTT